MGFDSHDELVKPRDPRLKADVRGVLDGFGELDTAVKDLGGRAAKQLGTLGGGNHFIELCVDTEAHVWLMLHSGSRNIGKSLAEVHMARATEAEAQPRAGRPATSRCSSPGRRRWRPTGATSTGRSATR